MTASGLAQETVGALFAGGAESTMLKVFVSVAPLESVAVYVTA